LINLLFTDLQALSLNFENGVPPESSKKHLLENIIKFSLAIIKKKGIPFFFFSSV